VPSSSRVSTLELFFDLVFVFTITQLTAVLAAHFDALAVVRVLLMFGVIWWMYAGYAWLTNAVAPSSSVRRGFLIAGMCGFLGIALAIPTAFGAAGWAFGLGYLVVNTVHTGLFWAAGGPDVGRSLSRLAPLNAVSAGLVLAGCLLPGGWRYAGLAAALTLQIATPYLHPAVGYDIRASHFVERHGLVVIIALGESVVAIGVGAGEHRIDVGLLAMAVLGLMLAYLLWWAYFGGDDERAEHSLAAISDRGHRARTALHAFGYAHYPLLLGIIGLAAGLKKVIGHAGEPLDPGPALALGIGVALFLAADALFRRILSIGSIRYRLAGAAVALATVPLAWIAAWTQLAALFVALAVVEGAERVRGGSPSNA
jgi:low temperature requirement protein LtrA